MTPEERLIRQIKIAKIREQFESEWHGGKVASIEDFLRGVGLNAKPLSSVPHSTELLETEILGALLEAEIYLRWKAKQPLDIQAYGARFPQHPELVAQAFKSLSQSMKDDLQWSLPDGEAGNSSSPRPPSSNEVGDETPNEASRVPSVGTSFIPNQPPRSFGHFELIERLGHGGMGDVFKAKDTKHFDRVVAVKVIRHYSDESLRRFQNEAKALSQLDHPAIIRLHEFGQIHGVWYLSMQYVECQTLAELPTTTSEREFIEILLPVIRGVAYAHQRGQIHRDIKPSNILIDSHRKAYLTDFGLVKSAGLEGGTMTEQLLGSPHFMSPEQCRSSKQVDARTDIYSLGVVLYWQLAGCYPFHADSLSELHRKIRFERPAPIRERNKTVARDLEIITDKCLSKEPRHRYQTATELADDLQRFLNREPILAHPLPAIVRVWYWSRREPALAAAMSLSVITAILCLIAAILLQQNLANQKSLVEIAKREKVNAIEQASMEKELRSQAQAAAAEAEETTRFAQQNQLKSNLVLAEKARQDGVLPEHLSQESQFNLFPELDSLDCLWYRDQARSNVQTVAAVSTADWGLFDAAVSPNQELAAVVEKTGDLAVYEIATGKRLRSLVAVEKHPVFGFAWPRLVYLAVDTGIASKMPGMEHRPSRFYSSTTWLDDDRLLVAGTDGELIMYDLRSEGGVSLFRCERPIDRVHCNGQHILLADTDGKLILLTPSVTVVKDHLIEAQVTSLSFAPALDTWIVGTASGSLKFFDAELSLQEEVQQEQPVYDARVWDGPEGQILLVAAKDSPLQGWKIERRANQGLQLSATKIFKKADVQGENAIEKACVHRGFVVGCTIHSAIYVWNLAGDSPIHSFVEGCQQDGRDVSKILALLKQPDPLELRVSSKLESHELGLLHVDRMGCMRVFEFEAKRTQNGWRKVGITFGENPKVVADPKNAGRLWVLDQSGCLWLVNLFEDRVIAKVEQAHSAGRVSLCALQNGEVATVGDDPFIKIWRVSDHSSQESKVEKGSIEIREVRRLECSQKLRSLAVHEPTSRIAGVEVGGTLAVWDLSSGRLLSEQAYAGSDVGISPGAEEGKPKFVHTGELSFSKSGLYLCYFGSHQSQVCLETKNWTVVDLQMKQTAGVGGEAMQFSPIVEHRLLESSGIGGGCNRVSTATASIWDSRLPISGFPACVDFVTSFDARRILGLHESGQITSFSSEHLLRLATLPGPVTGGACNLAVGLYDSSLATSYRDGSVYWYPLKPWSQVDHFEWESEGKTQEVAAMAEFPHLRFASWSGCDGILDHDGHPTDLFLAGAGGNTGPDNRLYRLQREKGIPRLKPVSFKEQENGPSLHARLQKGPDGKLHSVLRQGKAQSASFDGRVLLLHEASDPQAPWESELILDGGNQGFAPWLHFDPNGQVQSVMLFDYAYQSILRYDRPSNTGSWTSENLATFCGLGLRGCRSQQQQHFLGSRNLGFDSWPPYVYSTLEGNKPQVQRNAMASVPLLVHEEHLIAWSPHYRAIYAFSFDEQRWLKLAQFPHEVSSYPFLDDQKRAWCAIGEDRQILLMGLDLPKALQAKLQKATPVPLTTARLTLDVPIPSQATLHACLNGQGYIEVLLLRGMHDSSLSLVQSEKPFTIPLANAVAQ